MKESIIIIGGKDYDIDTTNIIYSFDKVCRVNLNTKGKSVDKKDIFYVNNHVYLNFIKYKKTLDELKKIYNFMDFDVLKKFKNVFDNKEYRNIIQQYESGKNNISNDILKSLNCPYKFEKAPRCGYQAILYFLRLGLKVNVIGFSFTDEINITYGNNKLDVSECHEKYSELKILHWLHDNNFIDATLCMIENNKLPLINCILKPKLETLDIIIIKYGIVLLKNYYNMETIEKINDEYDRIFNEYKNKIEVMKNNVSCSNDGYISDCDQYSEVIKNIFSDDELFNSIAKKYVKNNNVINTKTVINNENNLMNEDDFKIKKILYLNEMISESESDSDMEKESEKKNITILTNQKYIDKNIFLINNVKKKIIQYFF